MSCKLIELGDGMTAFVCGHKDHKCDDKGVPMIGNSDGFQCEEPKDQEEYYRIQQEHNITWGSCTCSVCGKPGIMDAPYL